MPGPLTLTVNADVSGGLTALLDLCRLLLDAPDPGRELAECILDAPQAFIEVRCVGLDSAPASSTGEILLCAQLTEEAGGLLSALRAGNVEADVLERALVHFQSPVVRDTPTVEPSFATESPAGTGLVPQTGGAPFITGGPDA